jgi:hypothetical protein
VISKSRQEFQYLADLVEKVERLRLTLEMEGAAEAALDL